MKEYIKRNADNIANMVSVAFLTWIITMATMVTSASSMSGATQTLREKGVVETHNGQVYFLYSQEQPLDELDYLSLAKLSGHYDKGVIIITD